MADKCKHLMQGLPDCVFCDRDRLRAALKGLSDMYGRTWDRVDGALIMLAPSVSLFEEAHRAARIALGESACDFDDPPRTAHKMRKARK